MALKYAKHAAGSTDTTTTLTQLYGYSFRESATVAAAATVALKKTNASGDIVIVIEIAANGSETQVIATGEGSGLNFNDVIYIDVLAGEVEGALWGH